ncbi:hypothetical protein ACOSQ4_004258 [Xanthoceras sorbifolium]
MESTDGSIRRSRSMSHVNHQEHGHNNSDQGDGYASEDLESGRQRRKDPSPLQELDKNLSSSTKNSTSNEGDEEQLSLINEKKQERMTSDKQAARRSRMRKQKHLDELWSQVISPRNENHQLTDTLNATANAVSTLFPIIFHCPSIHLHTEFYFLILFSNFDLTPSF